MVGPSLSKIERERIATAAKLEASGVKVQWRNVGRRLSYVVDGKDHVVLTSVSDRVHVELTRQVAESYQVERSAK